jgi:apolipoprotein D and lipocalin family protein
MKIFRSTCAALALGLAALSLPALAAGDQQPLQTIERLDLQRYLGTWHEIARTPNWFQQRCAGESRAEYSLNPAGTLRVVNRCRLGDGSTNEAVGEARRVGGADSAQLLVRFAPAWLSWLPMVWGDYWVIDLDPDYQLVAVSEPKREYLWVLARQPRVDEQAYQALLQRLQHHGFDLSKLQRSPQR